MPLDSAVLFSVLSYKSSLFDRFIMTLSEVRIQPKRISSSPMTASLFPSTMRKAMVNKLPTRSELRTTTGPIRVSGADFYSRKAFMKFVVSLVLKNV